MTSAQPVKAGDTVNVHYVGTLEDGTEFDNSRNREDTLSFQVGGDQVIKGFSDAVVGMEIGETRQVQISPENAYGYPMKEALQTVARTLFPEGFELVRGASVSGQNALGQPILAKILDYTDTEVEVDMNHPLAGKTLNFEIELVNIRGQNTFKIDLD